MATLDERGRLDELPFMPEMLRHCGQALQVYKRADKTCVPVWHEGLRRIDRTLLLAGARCDGSEHGGCQAGCLFFWKEAWLQPVIAPLGDAPADRAAARVTREDLAAACRGTAEAGEEVFVCQATDLRLATTPLPAWDVRQYVRDVTSGNVAARHALPVLARGLIRKAARLGRQLAGRVRAPSRRSDGVSVGQPSAWAAPAKPRPPEPGGPVFAPGDRVRVRGREEIEATLDPQGRHRGLAFRPEMFLYCGRDFPVLYRLNRTIDERTGRMRKLNDCYVLDEVACRGDFARFCPRANYFYWHDAWLARVGGTNQPERSSEATRAS